MPKKRTSPPPPAPRYLKFRFHVPFIIPVSVGASKLPMAREKCKGMMQHGDYVLNLDTASAHPMRSHPDNWIAEIAWTCPDCQTENWFTLNHDRTCKDRCTSCSKLFVVIEGFIHRMEKGCDTCDKRIECLLDQRAEVVTIPMEETL